MRRRDHTEEESPGPWRKAVWDKEPPRGAWDCFGVLRAPREAASHRFLEDGLSRETSMSIASAGLGSEKKRESRNDQLDENAPQQNVHRAQDFLFQIFWAGQAGGRRGVPTRAEPGMRVSWVPCSDLDGASMGVLFLLETGLQALFRSACRESTAMAERREKGAATAGKVWWGLFLFADVSALSRRTSLDARTRARTEAARSCVRTKLLASTFRTFSTWRCCGSFWWRLCSSARSRCASSQFSTRHRRHACRLSPRVPHAPLSPCAGAAQGAADRPRAGTGKPRARPSLGSPPGRRLSA